MLQRWFRGGAGHRAVSPPSSAAGAGAPLSRAQRWRARGQALPLLAIMLVALIGFTGLALDVSMLLLRTLQQQRAADAAALAGVIKLPQQSAEAKALAQRYAGMNGYVNNPDPAGFPQVDAQPVPGYSTRLHVIITARHPVYFMRIFGFNDVPVTRDAYAQYSLPVRLGSPNCTSFGVGNPTPVAIGNGPGPGNCPNCDLRLENFWASIDGPGTDNRDGDYYNTKFVRSADGFTCINDTLNTSTVNSAYVSGVPADPRAGYNYGLHVDADSGSIDLYVYDPAQFYRTGFPGTNDDTRDSQLCSTGPTSTRYRFRTYFQLYEPDSTPDLFLDDVPMGAAVSYEDNGTDTYHNKWFRVGTLPADKARNGDFRLQVYTNDGNASGTYGAGQNQYSLALGGLREPTNTESIYGISKLSLFNNIRGATGGPNALTWYLAQITREHARERMSVMMYDPGDATCNTNMQLFRQSDPSTPVEFDLNWTHQMETRLVTTDMTYPVGDPRNRPYDGQWVTLGVTLPDDYTDDYWLVKYSMAGCASTSTDRSVWHIVMLGNPIHLVNQLP
jgi:hypothetical protein